MFGRIKNETVGAHTKGEWRQVLGDQGYSCFWCGNPVCDQDTACDSGVTLTAANRATKDHLCPLSRGGVDFVWNIVAACESCNNLRNNRMPGEFLRDRLAFSKPVDKLREIYTAIPFTKERDEAGDPENGIRGGKIRVTGHLEISEVGAHLVRTLAAKMPTIERSDEWYQQRRKTLAKQVVSVVPRLLEAAGQMQLSLEMPSSIPKPPQTDEAALTFRGMHVTEKKA
jgi:hypothetical protein